MATTESEQEPEVDLVEVRDALEELQRAFAGALVGALVGVILSSRKERNRNGR